MNPDEIRIWCHANYGAEFLWTPDEIEVFIGQCLAMNVDPRMRPRQVEPRRTPTMNGESGQVYAHRFTWAMEYQVEEIFRSKFIMFRWGHGTYLEVPSVEAAQYGASQAGDVVCVITLTDYEAQQRYEQEIERRYNEVVASLREKPSLKERVELRAEIRTEMGEKPDPRSITGVGVLLAHQSHEEGAGRFRTTRQQRAEALAKRDAINQRFPELFASVIAA